MLPLFTKRQVLRWTLQVIIEEAVIFDPSIYFTDYIFLINVIYCRIFYKKNKNNLKINILSSSPILYKLNKTQEK